LQPVEQLSVKESLGNNENADENESPFEYFSSKRSQHGDRGPAPKLKVSVSSASFATIQSGMEQKDGAVESEPPACESRSRLSLDDTAVVGEEAHDRHSISTASYHGRDGYFAGGVSAVVAGRYRVMAVLGRGVFASVARCMDLTSGADVALKILRRGDNAGTSARNDALLISGTTETATLRALQSEDRGVGVGHIIKLLDTFEFEGHACLVLERMHTSLRYDHAVIVFFILYASVCSIIDIMDCRALCRSTSAFSKTSLASAVGDPGGSIGPPGGGIFVKHVLTIARQVLEGLKHMHNLGYVHADLKPDNILLDQTLTLAKICDFGTCIHVTPGTAGFELSTSRDVPRHGYIAARFYRAPEVALGFGRVSSALDMWALCVTIAEMCSGSILFKGNNNNELIWDMMTHLGPMPRNLTASSRHAEDFVDVTSASLDYYILRREPPKETSICNMAPPPSITPEVMPRPSRSDALQRLLRRMLPPSIREADINALPGSAKKEWTKIVSIRDFFANKGLVYDPVLRCSAEKALAELAVLEGHVK
jgi:serine/threonine-protein kinase PRP4